MLTFNGTTVSLAQMFVWLVVAMLSGIIAEVLFGYTHIGLLSASVLGLLGALLGTWAADTLRLPSLLTLNLFGIEVELIWCTLGSIVVIGVLQSLRVRRGGGGYRRRSRREY